MFAFFSASCAGSASIDIRCGEITLDALIALEFLGTPVWMWFAFLLFTGIKMWMIADHEPDILQNGILRFLKRHLPLTDGLRGNAFWVRGPVPLNGKLVRSATPLILALVLAECVDIVFAVDSIPAIFAVTTDPFIVYTSNILAILGLRALYFTLAAMMRRFQYHRSALVLVLVFIGTKIFLIGIIGKTPPSISLSVTLGLIIGGMLYSIWKTRPKISQVQPMATWPEVRRFSRRRAWRA